MAPLSNQERSPGQARRMGTTTIMAVTPERNRPGMSLPLLTPHDYMAADCAGIFLAFSLFSLLAVTPGYALGWLLDLLHFRTRGFPCRLALSVALSIALGPVISYFALRYALVLYAALAIFACVLFIREFAFTRLNPKIMGAIVAWIFLAVLLLTDLQFGNRLYFSLTAFDYAVRASFTHSIATLGVPALESVLLSGPPCPAALSLFLADPTSSSAKVGTGCARCVDGRKHLVRHRPHFDRRSLLAFLQSKRNTSPRQTHADWNCLAGGHRPRHPSITIHPLHDQEFSRRRFPAICRMVERSSRRLPIHDALGVTLSRGTHRLPDRFFTTLAVAGQQARPVDSRGSHRPSLCNRGRRGHLCGDCVCGFLAGVDGDLYCEEVVHRRRLTQPLGRSCTPGFASLPALASRP